MEVESCPSFASANELLLAEAPLDLAERLLEEGNLVGFAAHFSPVVRSGRVDGGAWTAAPAASPAMNAQIACHNRSHAHAL